MHSILPVWTSRKVCVSISYTADFVYFHLYLQRLAGATLLVFANKQDLPGALSAKDIREVCNPVFTLPRVQTMFNSITSKLMILSTVIFYSTLVDCRKRVNPVAIDTTV